MKIICDREKLLSAFQKASPVASARSPKAILQNVKLEVQEQCAVFMATDLEMGIRVQVDGEGLEIQSSGSVVLPVSQFGAILRESTGDKVEMEADPNSLQVRCGRSRFKLPVQNPDEFPAVTGFEEQKYHTVPAAAFRNAIHRTLFATDTESSRYALGGVLLEMEADKITAVATDGRRLAKMEIKAEAIGGHATGDTMTIIPQRSMQLIERTLADEDAEIDIATRSNDVLIRTPKVIIYSRLVEGRFPKWRDVFPQRTQAVRIDLQVGPVYSALRQAAIVTDADSRGIDFQFGEGKLVLKAKAAEKGDSEVEMPIAYDATPIAVTLDHQFVADFLRALDAERGITIEIENQESAALFLTDDGYGYVVMPLARDRG
jgi:DNA polymerase-3 subunit beta